MSEFATLHFEPVAVKKGITMAITTQDAYIAYIKRGIENGPCRDKHHTALVILATEYDHSVYLYKPYCAPSFRGSVWVMDSVACFGWMREYGYKWDNDNRLGWNAS